MTIVRFFRKKKEKKRKEQRKKWTQTHNMKEKKQNNRQATLWPSHMYSTHFFTIFSLNFVFFLTRTALSRTALRRTAQNFDLFCPVPHQIGLFCTLGSSRWVWVWSHGPPNNAFGFPGHCVKPRRLVDLERRKILSFEKWRKKRPVAKNGANKWGSSSIRPLGKPHKDHRYSCRWDSEDETKSNPKWQFQCNMKNCVSIVVPGFSKRIFQIECKYVSYIVSQDKIDDSLSSIGKLVASFAEIWRRSQKV